MKYDELYKKFISEFPDDEPAINAIAAENAVDNEDGMHIAFGMVVLPFLSRLVEENQTAKIEKAFAYFEEMASSDDHLISPFVRSHRINLHSFLVYPTNLRIRVTVAFWTL